LEEEGKEFEAKMQEIEAENQKAADALW